MKIIIDVIAPIEFELSEILRNKDFKNEIQKENLVIMNLIKMYFDCLFYEDILNKEYISDKKKCYLEDLENSNNRIHKEFVENINDIMKS